MKLTIKLVVKNANVNNNNNNNNNNNKNNNNKCSSKHNDLLYNNVRTSI